VDAIDEYLETIIRKDDGVYYKYGAEERKVTVARLTVPYRTGSGRAEKVFTVYRTHHGPIVRASDGKWVAMRLMQEPVKALTQSYTRTKANNLAAFRQTMELHTNSSNNTVFADRDGNIAYFHANFIPRRDPRFDWRKPVDGSDPATEWNGVLSIDESPNVVNPSSGWLYNTNNWPYSAAGPSSPKRGAFPKYVENGTENVRGVHAMRVLENKKGFTLDGLVSAAYDSALPAFDDLLPALFRAFDQLAPDSPLRATLTEPVALLRAWDRRWGVSSVPTTLAVYWGDELRKRVRADAEAEDLPVFDYMATRSSPEQRLQALAAACQQLEADFGTWKTPWGEVNRFQRLTGDIVQPFSDAGPSTPVGFTSSTWGSLASFGARKYPGTKRMYGTSGNSFVAVVEFGDTVKARAVTAGGLNSVPGSKHFNDQATRYATGELREVYFYPKQLDGHVERRYQPGQAAPGPR
jgi:acyl-homoserine lactone acylase PvdQ